MSESDIAAILSADAQRRWRWFHNAMRILLNLDGDQFPGPESDWPTFRDDPWRYFIRADDDVSARLYRLIEDRKEFPR